MGLVFKSTTLTSMKERIANLDQQMRGVKGKDRRGLRNARNRLASQLESLNPDGTSKSFAMGVQDSDQMVNTNILLSGEVERPALRGAWPALPARPARRPR